jgi:hypothetical protein
VASKPALPTREPAEDEPTRRRILFREIEQLLATGFTGQITLHCHEGRIPRYTVEETRQPGRG